MTQDRVSIRAILLSLGVPEAEVGREVRRGVLPWPSRVADDLRLLCGGNRLTSEFCLIEDIANCASAADIEEAFFFYYNDPSRTSGWAARLLGIVPRRTRTLKFFQQLKALEKPRRGR